MSDEAVRCAARIVYRPAAFVAAILDEFRALPHDAFPDDELLRRNYYQLPVRMSATWQCFRLRALHWPMLSLLPAAERQRRAFADAIVAAVGALRPRN